MGVEGDKADIGVQGVFASVFTMIERGEKRTLWINCLTEALIGGHHIALVPPVALSYTMSGRPFGRK